MGIFVPKDAEFKNPGLAALGRIALGLFIAIELIALVVYLGKNDSRPVESQRTERTTTEAFTVKDLTERGRLGTVSLRGGNPSPADNDSEATRAAPTQQDNAPQASGGTTGTGSTSGSSSTSSSSPSSGSSTGSQSSPPPSDSSDSGTQSGSGGDSGSTEPSSDSTGGTGGGGAGGGGTGSDEGSESEEGGSSGGGGAGP